MSTTNSKTSAVGRACYRALLRWTKNPRNQRAKFRVMPDDVKVLSLGKVDSESDKTFFRNIEGVRSLLMRGRDVLRDDENMDVAFKALRTLNGWYTNYIDRLVDVRYKNMAASGKIDYRLGQVFRHKKFHYRGVILGWDLKCERGKEWMKNFGVFDLPNGANQTFYWVLPDQDDCIKLFGSSRDTKYVAQDNIEPLTESDEMVCSHVMLDQFFQKFDGDIGRYIPYEDLAFRFGEAIDGEAEKGGMIYKRPEKPQIEKIPTDEEKIQIFETEMNLQELENVVKGLHFDDESVENKQKKKTMGLPIDETVDIPTEVGANAAELNPSVDLSRNEDTPDDKSSNESSTDEIFTAGSSSSCPTAGSSSL